MRENSLKLDRSIFYKAAQTPQKPWALQIHGTHKHTASRGDSMTPRDRNKIKKASFASFQNLARGPPIRPTCIDCNKINKRSKENDPEASNGVSYWFPSWNK